MNTRQPPKQWDLFCTVIDNHGDLGVCWRLARQLADAGQSVRLWVDDASALAWMAPDNWQAQWPHIRVRPWADASDLALLASLPPPYEIPPVIPPASEFSATCLGVRSPSLLS